MNCPYDITSLLNISYPQYQESEITKGWGNSKYVLIRCRVAVHEGDDKCRIIQLSEEEFDDIPYKILSLVILITSV